MSLWLKNGQGGGIVWLKNATAAATDAEMNAQGGRGNRSRPSCSRTAAAAAATAVFASIQFISAVLTGSTTIKEAARPAPEAAVTGLTVACKKSERLEQGAGVELPGAHPTGGGALEVRREEEAKRRMQALQGGGALQVAVAQDEGQRASERAREPAIEEDH